MQKMIRKFTFLFFFLIHFFALQLSAQDSSRLRVSLLTCTPGEELYAIFGHSAIRIVDSTSMTDYVYNYGTFNFNDEGFYLKFIRGKLMYYVSLDYFENFKMAYQAEGRGMTEQLLNFSGKEKMDILHALNENLKEENKYYLYDFFLDNCTTRLRDLILQMKTPAPQLPAVMPENTRFRQAIHAYLDKGRQYWSKLGIDILLGSPTDRVMTAAEQQFLPDNLMKAIDSSRNISLVTESKDLYDLPKQNKQFIWFTPILFFVSLLGLYLAISLMKNNVAITLLRVMDGFLFFMTGLLGIILVLMWIATDHSMTKNYFNLLWAWPTHLIASFFISSRKKISRLYFCISAIILSLVLLSWFFLPQEMNNALIPFVLLLIYRSSMRSLQQD